MSHTYRVGVIGRVLEVRWRGGHRGPLGAGVSHAGVSGGAEAMTERELGATWWHRASDGGGAMLDFCSYGALAARWYIGEPGVSAIGMRANLNSPWGDADDNGAMIVRFSRAMGVFEGTWDHQASGSTERSDRIWDGRHVGGRGRQGQASYPGRGRREYHLFEREAAPGTSPDIRGVDSPSGHRRAFA